MSYSNYDDGYDDQPRRYHSVHTRPSQRGDSDYIREEVYVERGKGAGLRTTDMVYRGRDREESLEDTQRGFRRTKSTGGRRRDDYYDDDRASDYAIPAAAGAAGYQVGRRRERERRRRDDRDYDSDSPPPRDKDRRKSGIGDTLEGLGLGGLAGAFLGSKNQKDKDKDRSRSDSRGARPMRSRSRAQSRRGSSSDRSRSRSRGGGKRKTERKWAQAAQAALISGAIQAIANRKEPGGWGGDKGKRVATAALSSGAIDGFLDRDPDKKSKRHLLEAVIGGLVVNRAANGPRSKSRGPVDRDFSPDSRAPRSRSRSVIDRFRGRSQSRNRGMDDNQGGGGGGGALKGLVAGGAVAAAGKAIYDRVRSKSRKRRSPSRSSSADSYVPSRNRRRDRRRSSSSDMTRTRQIGGATGQRDLARSTNGSRAVAAGAAGGAAGGALAERGGGGPNHEADKEGSDSSSTTDMENKRKRMRGKEMITAGLAAVATIHAAHGVYSSMTAHEKRHRLVAEGEMTPEEARKKQTKAWIQDAAAVGIAALGIKGAFSEWKEMNEQRREIHEIEKRKSLRRKKLIKRQRDEERDRHERMLSIMERNPQMAMGYTMQQQGVLPGMGAGMGGGGGGGGGYSPQQPPPADQSGNPYASGGASRQ